MMTWTIAPQLSGHERHRRAAVRAGQPDAALQPYRG